MKKMNIAWLCIIVTFFAVTGCQKQLRDEPFRQKIPIEKPPKGGGEFNTLRIDPYPLDWENIDQMPTPPGFCTVYVPWASGSSRQFPQELAFDYHSVDGWELMYNTFNTTSMSANWYFVLYNKYRGLMRMYYFVPCGSNFIPSANIIHKLATEGSYANSSPMMNFAAQEFVDVNVNSRITSTIEQWQVAPATWYVLQYELAYDQNMQNQSYNTFNFLWPLRSGQITNITMNGVASGTLTGTINTAGSDFTIAPNFNISTSNTNNSVVINGSSDAEKLKPTLGQAIVNNIKSAITSGAQGIIKNLLSGIFKKNSSTPAENVNLKIKMNLSLTGQLTSDFLLTSPAFAIPGYNQTTTTGVVPAYNNPLGVFYITDRPDISLFFDVTHDPENHSGLNTFTIDQNSYQYIFNPAVTSIATIQNIQQEILVHEFCLGGVEPIGGSFYSTEMIGLEKYYRFFHGGVYHVYHRMDPQYGVYLRISFDVVPNNGATPVRIAKTFVCDILEN